MSEWVTVYERARFAEFGTLYTVLGEHHIADNIEKHLTTLREVEALREKTAETILQQVRSFDHLRKGVQLLRKRGFGVCTNCANILHVSEILALITECAEPPKPQMVWETKELCRAICLAEALGRMAQGQRLKYLSYTEEGELALPVELDRKTVVWQGETTFCTNYAIEQLVKKIREALPDEPKTAR